VGQTELNKEYDSYFDTIEHIQTVKSHLSEFIFGLASAAVDHDASKLTTPEKELFDEWTPKLRGLTYGSNAYKAALKALKPALDHHYAENSHHPEYYKNGVSGMTLLDLVEMLCDWKAATQRHDDGDIRQSLEINRGRFNLSDQLYSILKNTIDDMGW